MMALGSVGGNVKTVGTKFRLSAEKKREQIEKFWRLK